MMHRRSFFRGVTLGVGGLYLAPFICQLEAASEDNKQPARILFFVQGNGVYPAEIQPEGIKREKNPSQLEDRMLSDHEVAFSMEPLKPWMKKMTMLHGLSGRIARGSHNSGFSALGCWPFSKKDYGETIDAALARNLDSLYRHVGLGVSNKANSMTYNLTASAKGKAASDDSQSRVGTQTVLCSRSTGTGSQGVRC